MKRSTYRILLVNLFLMIGAQLFAKPILPYFFGDHMVLQQRSTPAIWGWADKKAKINVYCSWNKKKYLTTTNSEGKWFVNIETPAAGGPFHVTISDGVSITLNDVLIGEVWLCSGQSNMEMKMKGFKDQPILNSNDAILRSSNSQIRLFTVPRAVQLTEQDSIKKTNWNLSSPESVADFSATAYYFGKYLHDMLNVPIGLVNISYGGSPIESFMDAETLRKFKNVQLPKYSDTSVNNRTPTVLYNAMLKPFIGYGIKGVIWYQGESNYTKANEYLDLFSAFVQLLRDKFNQASMPFYYAQIAPYGYPSSTGANSAFLREAQYFAETKIENAGMAVLLDAGDEGGIHPPNKEIVGKRLSYLALSKTYQVKGVAAESPRFDKMIPEGNSVKISFSNAKNGLTSFGKKLSLFEVAGEDKTFYPAKASIKNGVVILSSDVVPNPVAVRYGFKNFVQGDLFSTEGLPVSSFRTDNW